MNAVIHDEKAFEARCRNVFETSGNTSELTAEFSQLSGEQRIKTWTSMCSPTMGLGFAKFVHSAFAVLVLEALSAVDTTISATEKVT